MFEGLFRFLFKFRPVLFEQGDVVFGASRPMLVAVAVVAGLGVVALVTYRAVSGMSRRDQIALVALRLAVLAALVFCLARPLLVLRAAVPQQNFLGILLDDSLSMQIADLDDEARSAFVAREFGEDGGLYDALSKRFVLRFFRFASSADRVASTAELDYSGSATKLGTALDRARDELAGLPLAGLVVASDGADTSNASIDDTLASLKARAIPVFAVGLGEPRFGHDIEVMRVETPRVALKGTSLVVNVVLSQSGYAGQTVPLNVEDNGRIVTTQNVTLPRDGESATVPIRFTAGEPGPRTFQFRVPEQNGEQVTQNNVRDAMIEVADRRDKILYFEGEPRFEIKFITMALEDDKNIQLVRLLRSAENKYWRGGVDNPDELATGFPKTREELFQYRAIILGSVEAGAFTPEQQRMLADFVSRRGGGLMMLGGRRSFGEGGWEGTPLAEALPVDLDAASGGGEYLSRMVIRPTHAGELSPILQLADTEEASADRWRTLPTLSSVNRIGSAKPGATVLLTGTNERGDEQVVLASQRYGRGHTMAFAVQDTLVWQMDASIPLEDMTHETLWRRLARWLVDGVPGAVTITTREDRVDPGEPIALSADVMDGEYLGVNDGQVVAHLTSPSGRAVDVPMEWTVENDGEYRASYVPDEEGTWEVRVDAARSTDDGSSKDLGADTLHVRVSNGNSEFFGASLREPLLRRIAEETGGRYYSAADSAALPEAISYSGRGVTVVEEHDLWDMPAILLVLLGGIAGEWALRRKRGLA